MDRYQIVESGCGQYIVIGKGLNGLYIWTGETFKYAMSYDDVDENSFYIIELAKYAKQFITLADANFYWSFEVDEYKNWVESFGMDIFKLTVLDLVELQEERIQNEKNSKR